MQETPQAIGTSVRNRWELNVSYFNLHVADMVKKSRKKEKGRALMLDKAEYIVTEGLGLDYKSLSSE
ncbi:hypothetical protein SCUCBS95973_009937, partial [Sporothrix curviconia]